MADHYLDLEFDVRREALEFAASESGRPAYLLEKDIRVVWTLRTLFTAPFGASRFRASMNGGWLQSATMGAGDSGDRQT